MDKRFWLTGFSFGLMLSLSACTEVEHCKRGDDGCIGGPCVDKNKCDAELTCVNEVLNGAPICGAEIALNVFDCGDKDCVDNGGAGDGDGDGPGDGDGMKVPCNCTGAGQLCVSGTSDQCVTYCEDPGFALSVSQRRQTQVLPCRVDFDNNPVSYADACKAAFRQFCLRAEAYCVGGAMPYVCDPGVLESQEIQDFCLEKFPVFTDLAAYCEGMRDGTCDTFTECSDPAFPKSCTAQLTCNNTCTYPNSKNDGACDDGDLATAAYGVCPWGTDCGDCGPRKGTTPSPVTAPIPIGGLCVSHSQCVGNSDDLSKNKSWCLAVRGTELPGDTVGATRVFRCMSDCSLADNCSEGYTCTTLVDDANNPLTNDDGTIEARVCDPQICL